MNILLRDYLGNDVKMQLCEHDSACLNLQGKMAIAMALAMANPALSRNDERISYL